MNRKKVLSRILQYVKPYRVYVAGGFLFALFGVGLTLYAPILIGRGVDLVVGPGKVDFTGLVGVLIELGILLFVAAFFTWLIGLCANKTAYYTSRDLRNDLFDRLSRVPLRYIDNSAHGDLISRVTNDIDAVADGLLQGFLQLFTAVITILGTLILMLSINPIVTLVVVVLTPLSMFVASFIGRRTAVYFRDSAKLQGELSGYAEEMVGGAHVVKAFGFASRTQKSFEEKNARLYDAGLKAQFYSALVNPSTRFVNGLVYAAVGVAGAFLAIGHHITVGELSCFLAYANQYTKPFNEITGVITQLQAALASARRAFTVLDQAEESADAPDARVLTSADGDVALEDVCFSYTEGTRLIENFSLTTKRGMRVALVGPTGCGKTTIINLLMRFYDVDKGAVRVGSEDIRNVTRDSLRALYGMVLQDTWLFSGSVRDNIAYGRPGASMEEIVAAAKEAHAHAFIKRLPGGYDYVIAEAGGNISEGQKQLLSIARVMLSRPPMLILDEATSSIDTRTEILVQRAFTRMMEDRTSFVVAHRLSTIREADLILVMKAGKIVERGRHDELLAKKGFYAELFNSQFGGQSL